MPEEVVFNINAMRTTVVAAPGDLHSKKTRQLFEWWQGFSDRPPYRSQFDMLDHVNMASHLFLIEVVNSTDFRFNLNGEEVDRILGHASRGEIVSTITPNASLVGREPTKQVALAAYYLSIIEQRSCRMCRGDLIKAHNGHHNFESIDCPLRGEDGTITHIVGVIDSLPAPKEAASG